MLPASVPVEGLAASESVRWHAFRLTRVIDLKARGSHTEGMVNVGLYVRLEAKPGREAEVEEFLRSGLEMVHQEPATTAWFALKLGKSTFGIFDSFHDDAGRQAHLSGRLAATLVAKASDLFAKPPVIEKVDVLASKLPGG